MSILYAMGLDYDVDQEFYRGVQVMDFIMDNLGIDIAYLSIPKSADFLIVDSKVQQGVFDKGVVGTADNSVIHHVFLSYGHKLAAKFIHLLQIAATSYLDIVGFSVGWGDCVVQHEQLHDKDLEDAIQTDLKNGKKPNEGELLEATGVIIRLEPPEGVNSRNNNLLTMIQSGAKGSIVNFNQITRAVGQQMVGATRVPSEFGRGRTLPHFNPGDNGLYAGGYVPRSFAAGLTPEQFFFHAMGGRIGLIDTAVKTSSTGAQYRRLVKVLERAVVKEDGLGGRMVVNSTTNQIIQWNYGEDDFDGTYLKKLA